MAVLGSAPNTEGRPLKQLTQHQQVFTYYMPHYMPGIAIKVLMNRKLVGQLAKLYQSKLTVRIKRAYKIRITVINNPLKSAL